LSRRDAFRVGLIQLTDANPNIHQLLIWPALDPTFFALFVQFLTANCVACLLLLLPFDPATLTRPPQHFLPPRSHPKDSIPMPAS
jgi:hypothetical protein